MSPADIRLYVTGALVILLWLSTTMTAQAASVGIANILPGGGIIHKKVVSMREARYIDIVQQQTDFSCGAAAVSTILKFAYARDVTEPEVVAGMLEVSDPVLARERGFSLLDIKRYLEKIGLRGRGYKISYNDLIQVKIPAIILLDLNGYKHFVVLKDATEHYVYLADPALGNKRMKRNEFIKSWNGVVFAVIGEGFQRNTVLREQKGPPTVRRVALDAPLTDAELFEFGFTHSDLF